MKRARGFFEARRWALVAALLAVAVVMPARALAESDDDEVEDTGKGTARVRLSESFALPFLNGARWAAHIFEDNGRLLLLRDLDRSETYEFELNPMNPNLENATVVIGPDCWKLQTIRRGVVEWRCEQRVTFKRAPKTPPPMEEPPPDPDDDFEIPPMPGVPPPPPPRDPFDD